jgi:hypothetical protein
MALSNTSPLTSEFRVRLSVMLNQMNQALAAYSAGGGVAPLLTVVKTQSQIVSALLNATGLATPSSVIQATTIASLR